MTTDADLRALAEGATDGPWEAVTSGVSKGDHWYVCAEGEVIVHIASQDGLNEDQRGPDAEFIAAAREAVPALLDRVERAEAFARDVLALAEEWGAEAREYMSDGEPDGELLDLVSRSLRDLAARHGITTGDDA